MYAQTELVTRAQEWLEAVLATDGVSFMALVRESGVSKATVARIKSGVGGPNPPTLKAIAASVGSDPVEVRRFLDGTRRDMPPIRGFSTRNNIDVSTAAAPTTDTLNVPLFVGVPASAMEWTEEHPHGLYPADRRFRPTFAVRVVGDCMLPFIHDGDTIVASRAAWEGDGKRTRPGREYVVCFTDGRMTFKVAKEDSQGRPGWFRLEPYNLDDPRYTGTGWDEQEGNVAWAAKVVQVNRG